MKKQQLEELSKHVEEHNKNKFSLNDYFIDGIPENTKHDNIIKHLNLNPLFLYKDYWIKSRYSYKRLTGEVDLLVNKENYILNFEIKENPTPYGRRKAIKQLKRTEIALNHMFPNKYRIFNFYVCGYYTKFSDKYKIEWINQNKMRNRKKCQ